MIANEIRPYQCHADHRRQTRDAVDVAQVGVFDIEFGGLHGAKACLNLPALFVGCHGCFRVVVANKDLQFRHAIGVFQQGSSNADIFTFEEKQLVVDTLLSELEAVKQMPCADIFRGFGITQPKILLDVLEVADASVVEIPDPFLADKLSVSDEGIDILGTEQPYKSINQPCPLLPVGIAAFVRHGEKQRKCNALVYHSKHKDIEVDLTEFPVGAIEAQNQSCLDWQKCKYHFGDKDKVESISGKQSLYAPRIGIAFNARRHRRRYLVQVDRLHYTKGVKYKRKQFYASQILAAQALRDDITGPRCSCIIGTI